MSTSTITLRRICAVGCRTMKIELLLASLCIASVGFAADTSGTVHKLKAAVTPGEVAITGTDVKTLHDGAAKTWRICVKSDIDSDSLALSVDATHVLVKPGDCIAVAGRRIKATSAQPLGKHGHIVVTFHEVKRQ